MKNEIGILEILEIVFATLLTALGFILMALVVVIFYLTLPFILIINYVASIIKSMLK